jgi:hypothetical protein
LARAPSPAGIIAQLKRNRLRSSAVLLDLNQFTFFSFSPTQALNRSQEKQKEKRRKERRAKKEESVYHVLCTYLLAKLTEGTHHRERESLLKIANFGPTAADSPPA